MKKVIKAKSAGFCFGVQRAVDKVYEELEKDNKVYTLGPIIHNQEVIKDISKKGATLISSLDEIKDNKNVSVLIRSHGVGKDVYEKAKANNINLVDATCPYVKKIHNIVKRHAELGVYIIIIGSPKHPEVEGIKAWGNEKTYVVENFETFCNLNLDKNKELVIVAQTTYNHIKFKEIIAKISNMGYSIKCFNTICSATHERQVEASQIAKEVDAMIVIGDKSSSNTSKLVEICEKECNKTIFIQTVADLDNTTLEKVQSVGITAGASTPKHIIEEVQNNVKF